MALDAGIYGLVGRGVKSVADYDAEAQAAKANKLALLMQEGNYGQQQQSIQDANALRAAYQGLGNDPTANYNALLRISPAAAGAYQKQILDAEKAKLDAKKTTADIGQTEAITGKAKVETIDKAFGTYREMLGTVQNPQTAAQFMQATFADPILGPMMARFGTVEDALKIPQDPEGFRKWQLQAAAGIEKVKEIALKEATFEEGKRQFGVTSTETARSNQAREGLTAAQLAEQRRHHNMVDSRSRESTAATMTKPFEVTGPEGTPILVQQDKQGNIRPVEGFGPKAGGAVKLTEGQGIATTFAARMTDAERVIKKMEDKGVTGSDFRTMAAGNNLTNWAASAEGQQYRQAQENWVTANLRKESGAAIPVAEMEKDIRKWFPSVGDKADVIAQKAAAREVATRGMMVQAGPGARQVEAIVGPDTPAKPAAPSLRKPKGAEPAPGLNPAEQAELEALRKRFK